MIFDDANDELYDLLDKVYVAETYKEAVKYSKKILKIDKDCLEAKLIILDRESDLERKKIKLEKAIAIEREKLDKDNYFDDCEGELYYFLEARTYLRANLVYLFLLLEMGKCTLAIDVAEEMLRLSNNDNLGVRYTLLILYTMMEKVDEAEKLIKEFDEDKTFQMLFPMALLYYKIDNIKKAKQFIKLAYKSNHYLKEFIYLFDKEDENLINFEDEDVFNDTVMGSYRIGQKSEILTFVDGGGHYLLCHSSFLDWARGVIDKLNIK